MGGRGASSSGAGGGGTFKNENDFEKSLKGANDPRLKEYSDALKEESQYNTGLKNVLNQVIGEDGFSAVADTIKSEINSAKNEIASMPVNKTPSQLGRISALNDRINMLNQIQSEHKNTKGSGRGNVEIV